MIPVRPGDSKYADTALVGLRLEVVDRTRYDPTAAALRLLIAIRSVHAERFRWIPAHFDRLAGTDSLRLGIEAGRPVGWFLERWAAERAAWMARRNGVLLYPD